MLDPTGRQTFRCIRFLGRRTPGSARSACSLPRGCSTLSVTCLNTGRRRLPSAAAAGAPSGASPQKPAMKLARKSDVGFAMRSTSTSKSGGAGRAGKPGAKPAAAVAAVPRQRPRSRPQWDDSIHDLPAMYSLPDALKGSRAAAKTVKFVPDATSTSPSKFDRLLQQRDPTGPTKPPTPKVDLKRLDGIASTVETAVAKLEQGIEQLEDRSHDTAAFRAEVLGALQDLRITNNERNRALDDLARDNVQLRDRVDGLATTLESMQLELSRLADRSAAASSTLTTQSVLGRTFTPTPYSYPVDDVLSGDIRMPPEQRAAFEQRYLDEGRATRPPVVVRRSTVVNVPVGASRASAPKFQLVNDENLMQPIRVPVAQRDGSPTQ